MKEGGGPQSNYLQKESVVKKVEKSSVETETRNTKHTSEPCDKIYGFVYERLNPTLEAQSPINQTLPTPTSHLLINLIYCDL